jgi:hypothetical protein
MIPGAGDKRWGKYPTKIEIKPEKENETLGKNVSKVLRK